MKAKRVDGLDAKDRLDESLRRIVAVRAVELDSFAQLALDPAQSEAQHDMRIAAKRLRYVLELAAPVLGEPAARAAKRARRLQTLLGEIHDCDEQLPLVRRRAGRLCAEDAAALRRAGGHAADLDPSLSREAPNRDAYRGLATLHAHLTARRALLHERFARYWGGLGHDAFDV